MRNIFNFGVALFLLGCGLVETESSGDTDGSAGAESAGETASSGGEDGSGGDVGGAQAFGDGGYGN